MTFAGLDPEQVRQHHPKVVFVDDRNKPAGTSDTDPTDASGGLL